MELQAFIDVLEEMSEGDIRRLAAQLQARFVSPADEMDWWRANLAIERLAGSSRARSQAVAMAGHRAARAVLEAAERSSIRLPDTAVTGVARAANRIACGLQVGSACAPHLAFLLEGWTSVLGEGRDELLGAAAA